MNHVIQLLRYDLSSHNEDISILEQKIDTIKKYGIEEDDELYNELNKLIKNTEELLEAIKILTKTTCKK